MRFFKGREIKSMMRLNRKKKKKIEPFDYKNEIQVGRKKKKKKAYACFPPLSRGFNSQHTDYHPNDECLLSISLFYH